MLEKQQKFRNRSEKPWMLKRGRVAGITVYICCATKRTKDKKTLKELNLSFSVSI